MTSQSLIISVGADHAGVALKQAIQAMLQRQGIETINRGTDETNSVDYPDYAQNVAKDVVSGAARFGVLVCGSGTGMAIAANKVKGIRAANCWKPEIAELARQHNNANVLVLPARMIDEGTALECMKAFLATEFEGGRHENRVNKIENC